jgi:hypothetical protein
MERMAEMDVAAIARAYFLDDRNQFGCAETTFIVLKGAYGLDDPMDAAAAMALNGGVAYSGGACGAITGAALAVGMLPSVGSTITGLRRSWRDGRWRA